VKVVNGSFTLRLRSNEVYTLTTVADGNKGSHGVPPNSSAFPVPYVETFESNSCSLHHNNKTRLIDKLIIIVMALQFSVVSE